jgi:hypothetical protein
MRWPLLALALSVAGILTTHASPSLRYDGLYYRAIDKGDGYTGYYRFFRDGVVLSTVSSGTPEQVATWLYRGHGSPIGRHEYLRYVIRDHHIRFIMRPHEQPAEYFAEVRENHLILRPYRQFVRGRPSKRLDFAAVHFTR